MATGKKQNKVVLYDTTLRDGTQAEDVSFSVEDKVRIALRLDDLGIDYIEGGWPGSNPRDIGFFKAMRSEKLRRARLVSFGSTRRGRSKAKDDAGIKALLKAGTQVVTIFGKTSRHHVSRALRVSMAENLEMIFDSVGYLKKRVGSVFYDAEHFFDGFREDPAYAMKTLDAAEEAGADFLVLCDTNGGMLPFDVAGIMDKVCAVVKTPLGIHAHNDSETAVANTLVAVGLGATMVQGTINGFGERCGNADLCSIIPALKLKMGIDCLTDEGLGKLRNTSRFVYELANLPHNKYQPYVGDSAFAHKGGIHVSAVLRSSQTYEHISPELVGNHRRVLVSDLSGRSNIEYKAKEYGIDLKSGTGPAQEVLRELKELEHRGFQYEGAEASFELLMQKALKKKEKYFHLLGFRVIDEKKEEGKEPYSEATIMLDVGGVVEHTAAEGNGPVNAMDKALRKALERFYPSLKEVKLLDFKVRVLEGLQGTSAKVRVLVESGDSTDKWGTVGVSDNVIEASWQALVDSLEYKLFKDKKKKKGKRK
jgi:2-isopropylmalate synthase